MWLCHLSLVTVLLQVVVGQDETSSSIENPCTPESMLAGVYYHAYPLDPSRYIQCTEHGSFFIRQCPQGTWSTASSTCVDNSQTQPRKQQNRMKASDSDLVAPDMNVIRNSYQQVWPTNSNGQNIPNNSPPVPSLWHGSNGQTVNAWNGNQNGQTRNGYNNNDDRQKGDPDNEAPNGKNQPQNGIPMSWRRNGNPSKGLWFRDSWSNTMRNFPSNSNPVNGGNGNHGYPQPTPWRPPNGNNKGVDNNPTIKGQPWGNNPWAGHPQYKSWYPKGNGSPATTTTTTTTTTTPATTTITTTKTPTKGYNGKSHQKGPYYGKSWQGNGKSSNGGGPDGKSSQWKSIVNMPNPCSDSNVQFISDPANPFKYFECVNGQSVLRECQSDYVWIQRDKQCKSLQPSVDDNSDILNNNPCLSGQQLLPYPGDDSKYIECIGWYRQEVRSCPQTHVWSAAHKICIPNQDPQPPTPTPPTGYPTNPDNDNGAPSEFCLNSGSFYHSYPPDPTRYIQCDEFGNMYLRYCGPSKKWQDFYKTCVGDQNYDDVDYYAYSDAKGAGQLYYRGPDDATNGKEGNTHYGNGIHEPIDPNGLPPLAPDNKVNLDNVAEPFLCPPESQWMESLGQCAVVNGNSYSNPEPMDCPQSMVWVTVIHGCLDVSYHSSIMSALSIPVNCPKYHEYDPQTGQCHFNPALGVPMPTNFDPDCPLDFNWSVELEMCIKEPTTTNELNGNGVDSALNGDSSNAFVPMNTDLNGGQDDEYEKIPLPTFSGDNPCTDGDAFFYPFPTDPRYFIQCDAHGGMFIHPCGYSLVWEQELLTCVPWSVLLTSPELDPNSTDSTVSMAGAAKEGMEDIPNPCRTSTQTFHKFPPNEYLYIMCVGIQPYMMPCPAGLIWDNDIQTCNMPAAESRASLG